MNNIYSIAADIMEANDWYHGVREDTGRMCLAIAISDAKWREYNTLHEGIPYYLNMAKFLGLDLRITATDSDGYEALIRWNDDVAESKNQVVQKLREMAKHEH